ncbi:MAG: hypothetical protein ABSG72_21205 [Candidatus Sulfotelmatobacter sp.]|jgi:hypothetical protein
MCCDRCHHEIAPGTERTLWDAVKGYIRVCAICFPFLASAMPPPTPPQRPAPDFYMYNYPASSNINVDSGSVGFGTRMSVEYWRGLGVNLVGEDTEKSG